MSEMTNKLLDFIPSISRELPAIAAGEPTTVDRLHLAASVCGWVTDFGSNCGIYHVKVSQAGEKISVMVDSDGFSIAKTEDGVTDAINMNYLDSSTLADIGRAFLNAAIDRRTIEKRDEEAGDNDETS